MARSDDLRAHHADPVDLEVIYDEVTMRRIEAWRLPGTRGEIDGGPNPHDRPARRGEGDGTDDADDVGSEPASTDRRAGGVRGRMAGAVLAGALLGLGEVLEPEKAKQPVVEFAPDPDPYDGLPVQFLFVPGSPQASTIVLRPWLAWD